ncbi:MAG: hypothetical protein CPDRYMAC_5658 [uncultured Paraburkholderia sp.]|nr:MAG: hypothetical protein CPDRYDRY_5609 [uncultured Paraburkholderia sp.]CAH2941852.1 MAG: hypothetical protein CPDRYMAC_5658 [uncultured Paraburkholderia sp.]
MIDCSADIAKSAKTQALVWKGLLDQVPSLSDWRSVIVAGTAFPQNLPASIFRATGTARRDDWLGYKARCSAVA